MALKYPERLGRMETMPPMLAEARQAIRRFIFVKICPAHSDTLPQARIHHADGAQFEGGLVAIYHRGLRDATRIEVYTDLDTAKLMYPECHVFWLDETHREGA